MRIFYLREVVKPKLFYFVYYCFKSFWMIHSKICKNFNKQTENPDSPQRITTPPLAASQLPKPYLAALIMQPKVQPSRLEATNAQSRVPPTSSGTTAKQARVPPLPPILKNILKLPKKLQRVPPITSTLTEPPSTEPITIKFKLLTITTAIKHNIFKIPLP